MPRYATQSEEMFAEYLEARRLRFDYEPGPTQDERAGRNPDFWVHTSSGVIVCEVTELQWLTSAQPAHAGEGVEAASIDSYRAIRRKLQDKHKQGRHLKGKHPYVVVLSFIPLHPAAEFVVAGAMYGDVAISIPIDPQGGPPPDLPARNIFTKGGRLQKDRLTTISAVALVEAVNPTKAAVERRIDERLSAEADLADIVRVAREEYEGPAFDPSARVVRLDVFHNFFAADPRLPRGVFTGPNDREFDRHGPVYGEVFRGSRYEEDVR